MAKALHPEPTGFVGSNVEYFVWTDMGEIKKYGQV